MSQSVSWLGHVWQTHSLAVCIAPVLMLLFGITPALVVLGVGLVFTACLCWSGSNQVGPRLARNCGPPVA